ncbi:MAG: biopolymer transporter ExbD, partial [Opitutales bacterium]|nr:biopolymer transporter ExbD [Opitutales bacterium]
MKIRRRNNLLVEPPHSATSDIAFILIIFFLVCASVQPDSGRNQTLPKSEEQPEKKQENKNPTVLITSDTITFLEVKMEIEKFISEMNRFLKQKKAEEDRVEILKSAPSTPYERWI